MNGLGAATAAATAIHRANRRVANRFHAISVTTRDVMRDRVARWRIAEFRSVRECLGERHLRWTIREFVEHYHGERHHQGFGNELIDGASPM